MSGERPPDQPPGQPQGEPFEAPTRPVGQPPPFPSPAQPAGQPLPYPPPDQPPPGGQTTAGYDSRSFAPPADFAGQTIPPTTPPVPPAPPRNNRTWLIVGGVAAVVLLCCCVVALVVLVSGGGLLSRLAGNTSAARNAATDYFDAVSAHNWQRAYNALSSTARTTTSSAALQSTWTQRESANGAVRSFSVTSTNINTNNGRTTATVVGTLRYTNTSETRTVLLVKEGSSWKISSPP